MAARTGEFSNSEHHDDGPIMMTEAEIEAEMKKQTEKLVEQCKLENLNDVYDNVTKKDDTVFEMAKMLVSAPRGLLPRRRRSTRLCTAACMRDLYQYLQATNRNCIEGTLLALDVGRCSRVSSSIIHGM
jgi:hypothetical protein